MKNTFFQKPVVKWAEKFSDKHEPVILIMQAIRCSASTAEAISRGKYKGVPAGLTRQALADLVGESIDILFPPLVRKNRSA